jgi:methyl-accepting chemotaxis protein
MFIDFNPHFTDAATHPFAGQKETKMNATIKSRGFLQFGRSRAEETPAQNELPVKAMLETLPLAVLVANKDFDIIYANQASRDALRRLQNVLPINADSIVGRNIDVFHKNPAHQRLLMSDRRNLPHKARISIGNEWLDLHVSALDREIGGAAGYLLSWSIVTDLVRQEAETKRLLTMLDMMPINVMLADKDTFEITYANKTSIATLRKIEQHLPCRADELVGKSIDIFHKNPSHQRRLLGDYQRNLPHRAVINVGSDKLELNVSALTDSQGGYLGPLVCWSVVTDSVELATKMEEVVSTVSAAATEMRASAEAMRATADSGREKASTVAAASEELSSSISEISRQISRTQQITNEALSEGERSMKIVNGLADAASKIGQVVNLINDIADQTNLLALNATIEAARAGEAGKGFAVVAAEVKALANQTAKATGDISKQVEGIQAATNAVVSANEAINQTLGQMNEIASTVAAAVEEQSAATQNVTSNIGEVSSGAAETGRIAGDVNAASGELAARSEDLRVHVGAFLQKLGVRRG